MAKKHRNELDKEDTGPTAESAEQAETKAVEDEAQPSDEEDLDTAAVEEELCEEDKLRRQVSDLEDKLLRTAAEFENYKKRLARQYDDMVRSSNDSLIMEFLEVVDNFERALNHDNNNTDLEAFRKGTELIFNQMVNLLTKYDVTPIEAVGQPFDPNVHDAMLQVDTDEFDEGIVAMEMARGYRQGSRVLRHSKVGVSTGKKKED